MKVITLAYDSAGKTSIIIGPEAKSVEHRKQRLAFRESGLPKGVVRIETYNLDASNRAGAVSAPAEAVPTPESAKPKKLSKKEKEKADREAAELAAQASGAASE